MSQSKLVPLSLSDGCNGVEALSLSQIAGPFFFSAGEMGRRAADLTAPVPVLGVPALVGVRGWRTITADRTGGGLLHSWGPQYNIGVLTSPGVGRPTANDSVQLTGTLPAPSDGIQMSNSFINPHSKYKEILKSDKEKGAISKLKTRSSKSKKEVTFQTAECEASKDGTCSLESSQTCCHAKEIKGNLHLSDSVGAKSKLKPPRYSNGSVVDSEAVGGISVDEAEPVTSSVAKKHTKLPNLQAEKSVNLLLFSGGRPVRTAQQICGHCGGRQLDAPGITPLDQKSLGETGINPLLTAGHFTTTELDHKLSQSPFKISDERIPVSSQLYLREESMRRKVAPPPCPLHSRINLAVAGNALFTQPSAFSAKTVNVTKATVETKPPHHGIISQATRLHLTPQMATATKSNIPHSHTYPQNRGIPQRILTRHSVPLSVCVSVHAAPDSMPPSLYTTAKGAGTIHITSSHRRTTEWNAALTSTENVAAANAKYETDVDGSKSKCAQTAGNCHTVSLAPSVSEAVTKLETSTQTAAVSQSSIPPSSGHQPKQRPSFSAAMDSSRLPAFSSAPCSAAPRVPLSTAQQCTLKQNSDKITCCSIKPATSQRCSFQPKYTNPETTLRVYATTPNAALNSPNHQNSTSCPLSDVAPNSTSMRRKVQTIALRNSSTYLKTSTPTPADSSPTLTEYQMNACGSAAVSLQSADETQHNRELAGNNPNQPGKGSGAQPRNEAGSGCAASASATCPVAVSELASLPKYHQRDTDASYSQSDISPRSNSLSGGNKVNSNPIRKLVAESKHHENSSVSQATSLRNYISLIKPSGSRLHACMSKEQRCEGYAERVGQRAACPPVNTDQQTKTVEKFAARREDVKLDTSADKHTHNPTASFSSLVNPGGDADSVSESLIQLISGSDTPSSARADKGPELSSTQTLPLSSRGNLYSGPECSPILPSSSMNLASRPHLQSVVKPDSKSGPSGPGPCLGDTGGAHAHPADVARLLPPSPQCCKSASLQQKLESVEASLAANKDRITTLLNIIHDLETSHTPSSR